MSDFFDGQVIYLVGASSGIGLAAARKLTELGASTVLFARQAGQLEKARSEVEARRRDDSQFTAAMPLDAVDRAQVNLIMAEAVERFGPPQGLINFAGRARPHYFKDIDTDQLDATIKANLYTAWNTISALAPVMEGGFIVNTSSLAGLTGVFGYTDYCASKFAVIGFSEALKSELKNKGVDVKVLCPPDTQTPALESENLTKPEETKAISASAKLMSADDAADALIKGIERKSFFIIPGFDGKLMYLVKRLAPGVVEWVMDRAVKKVQRRSHPEGA